MQLFDLLATPLRSYRQEVLRRPRWNLATLSEPRGNTANRQIQELPEKGSMCDLLWSDHSDASLTQWQPNDRPSCSYFLGVKQARGFLTRNGFKLIIGGHQVSNEGQKYLGAVTAPLTLTIFSAPNYSQGNKAAVAEIPLEECRSGTSKACSILPLYPVSGICSVGHYLSCLTARITSSSTSCNWLQLQMTRNCKLCSAIGRRFRRIRRICGRLCSSVKYLHGRNMVTTHSRTTLKKPGKSTKKSSISLAKVIGPKLDHTMVKIGSYSGESQEDDLQCSFQI